MRGYRRFFFAAEPEIETLFEQRLDPDRNKPRMLSVPVRRPFLWFSQVTAASLLLIFAHSLSGPAKMHGVDGPSFVLWRFIGGGILAGIVLVLLTLIIPASPSTKAKWTSLGDELGRLPDKWGITATALSAIGFVASMALLIDGLSRYGMTAMNVPVATMTVLVSVAVGYFVYSERLGAGQLVGCAIIVIGMVVFFFSSPDLAVSANAYVSKS